MRKRRINTSISFIDILFNLMLGVYILFMIAFILINEPNPKNGTVDIQAAVIITLTWPDNEPDDIDLWVLTPTSKFPIFYRNKRVKLAHLDRDDRGSYGEVIKLSDGSVVRSQSNWEHVTIRKLVPGHYVVNVVAFKKYSDKPINVEIKVEQIMPYNLIYVNKLTLTYDSEEKTAIQFTVDDDKNIVNTTTLPYSLTTIVQQRK